ncbi:MAG: T9SS type A sorting domain-containing protein [Thermaurantimonas sp.]|uniref:T9SS type A sorting domain-containing protein n=1 Tax=Thermaurantimonas TaxID=2681566 RepID=UPI0023F43CCD|nr:T9SS type A sorting domain-containing protein [Thermaurantimonas aggregans]MCX8147670.1 T9SS type A sorting domain-containing protein [Thermaurantimonas aggregans]
MKRISIFLITVFYSIFLFVSGGPIKEYELKKKKQLEELRKNPHQELKKMLRAASRSSSLYQQKPANVLIPDSIVNYSFDGTQYNLIGYEILQYSALQKVDFVKTYVQGNLTQTIDFQYPGTPFATTILVNSSPSSSSQPNEKMELFFDSQNKLIKTKTYMWVNNSWQLSMADSLHIINNTANPPKPQEIRYFVSEQGGPYKNVMSIKNITYDATTGLEKNVTFAIDLAQLGVPIDFIKYENCTWELGHLDLRSIFLNYEELCKSIYPRYELFETYNYAYNNGPTSYQASELDPATMQMKLTERLLPSYSGSAIAFLTRQEHNGTAWDTVGRIIPTVNAGKVQVIDYQKKVGTSFVLENRKLILYDAQGNYSGELYIFYTAQSVDTSGNKYERTYTGGKLTEEILMFYTPGIGYQPSTKDVFFYRSNISVNEFKDDQNYINIYPNPASTSIHLTLPFDAEWKISLTDLTGRPLKNDVLSGQMGEISLNGLPAGTYILTANSAEYIAVKKLIVR